MPYKSISDLPKPVRDHLPKHAQEIFKEAFNSAWHEYADPDNHHLRLSRTKSPGLRSNISTRKAKMVIGTGNNYSVSTKLNSTII